MSSLVLILLVTFTSTTSSTSSTTVVHSEKPWSWAEERAGGTILGRFVSEENTEQVHSVVDPVLGSLATQLSQPQSQPHSDNVLQGFFVQDDHSEVLGEVLGEVPNEVTSDDNVEYRDYDYESEQQLLTGEEAELTNFVEEHQYDYQDQIALPQTNQLVLPPPPPHHVVPQLHPPQHHHVQHHHQHQQRHHPVHQKGKSSIYLNRRTLGKR